MIAIDGRLETQAWTDRDGNNRVTVGIVAESVYFADSKREDSKPKAKAKSTSARGRGRKAA